MKKLLGIVVLGLLVCSNSFAGKIAVKKAIKLPKDIVQGYKNDMGSMWGLSCTYSDDNKCMTPNYDKSIAFKAACELIFHGKSQPSGYTEPLLHLNRLIKKN